MNIFTAFCTDVGIKKNTNQDSFCIKTAQTDVGLVAMVAICDGMGGLSKGEVASASVVNAFSNWFDNELKFQLSGDIADIKYCWERIIQEQNQKIAQYGRKLGVQLGTTVTVTLIIENEHLLIGHVGDTRVYEISDTLIQLTEDQTVVARDVKRGIITPEEAMTDSRKNVLLQCVGASNVVVTDYIIAKPKLNCTYMFCSDGFRHLIDKQEIYDSFAPDTLQNEDIMQQKASQLVAINKQRLEQDNITVVLIKIY